jgi:signal transduction histidine kinase
MRARLLATYLSLLALALLGLDIPLAVTLAARDAQAMFIDRTADTARFASLAEPALRTGRVEVLAAELRAYDAMFGIAAAVVARDGRLAIASRPGLDLASPALSGGVQAALSGRRAGGGAVLWPWGDDALVVAEPVSANGDVTGAVITISPRGPLNATTWGHWALLAAASAAVLLVGLATAQPLVNWVIRPVRDLDDGARALAAGRFGDRITRVTGPPELRNLVATFNVMSERVATLVERQRSFASYASHQLRAPLATLRLRADALARGPAPPGPRNTAPSEGEDHRLLVEEIDRLAGLCDALLAYARAEATAASVEDVDAAVVADARVAAWSPAAARAGIRISRSGQAPAVVRVAASALDQALEALLSNAVRFAGPGDVRVTVSRVEPGWVDIDVTDDGPGLSAEGLARAAEPFWRGADHDIDGSGLGVTIATALIRASGGRLDLMPAPTRGLRARIRLPQPPGGAGA